MQQQIGIDIGGTTIKGGLFERNKLLKEVSVTTPARAGRAPILQAVYRVIDDLMTHDVTLIGVASAGNIDPERGVCVYATNNLMGWSETDIRGELEKRYHLPILVENDAIAALKAELKFYPDAQNVTMLTFGTGLGGASLVNGKILRGRNFNGARWGHIIMVPDGLICTCGKRGCAECYLSGTGLLKLGRRRMLGLTDAKQIFERAEEGEWEAQDIVERFTNFAAVLLETIRTALAPEYIILGGGISNQTNVMKELITDAVDGDVVLAKLGDRAGLYGAILP